MGLVSSTCLHVKGHIIIEVCAQATVELRVPSSCDTSPAEGVEEEEDLFEADGFALVNNNELEELASLDGVPVGAFFRVLLEPLSSLARSSLGGPNSLKWFSCRGTHHH